MLCRGRGGGKRDLEDARGCKRSQEEPEDSEYSEYSEFSGLADTACRVPTMLLLSLTCRFQLSVQRSTLNAHR